MKLSVAPVTGQCDNVDSVTIDCAIVPNLNENMILTADVISRLSQCNCEQQNNGGCDDVGNTVVVGDENVVCNNDDADDVRPITSIVDNVDFHNAVVDRNTVVANDSIDGVSTTNFASCDQVAQEQKKDETLKGCFSLAKEKKKMAFCSRMVSFTTRKRSWENHSFSWWSPLHVASRSWN